MMLAGAGLAAGSSLAAAPLKLAGVRPAQQKFTEPAKGDQVIHRSWKSLGGESISLLGMGCMRFPRKPGAGRRAPLDQEQVNQMIDYALEHGINYFDTAPAYGDSERATGEALSKHKRESFFLATKMSNFSNADFNACKEMFARSLKNLRTSYFDYFLLHAISDVADFNKRFKDNGLLDWLIEQKKKGVIRHLGFSFHGSNQALRELLALPYDWEFVQIQLNYVDWKDMPLEDSDEPCDSETLYKMLAEKNIPVVIMEPLRGGKLVQGLPKEAEKAFERMEPKRTPVDWALRWVWNHPEVTVVLSGMNAEEQVEANCRTASESLPGQLSQKELALYDRVLEILRRNIRVGCTGCGYWQPCPKGVNIPTCFALYNGSYVDGYFNSLREYMMCTTLRRVRANAGLCVKCGKCEQHCPQHLPIREELDAVCRRFETPLYRLAALAAPAIMKY